MSALLDNAEIDRQADQLSDWSRDGSQIVADYKFKDFSEAMTFVDRVAEAAEEANHHPDIDIRWNKVHLVLTTHSEGGLTQNDFDMARRISDRK
jgi:4a-hydroxytetrahydrobiopterin dehydratase